ncbi:MAG: hypothetical protein RSB72_00155 [Bacilli bacterium]
MHIYYLFHINPDVFDIHFNDGYILYKTLENIYNLDAKNFEYGISLYNQLCTIFNIEILDKFLANKYDSKIKKTHHVYILNNDYIGETTFLKIGASRIYIKSNINLPSIIRDFAFYNQKIFVCDFTNSYFFWLSGKYNII